MATGKTSTLTFRIEPALKRALRTAAEREHRSIARRQTKAQSQGAGLCALAAVEPAQA